MSQCKYDNFRQSLFGELISMIPPTVKFQSSYGTIDQNINKNPKITQNNFIFGHVDVLHTEKNNEFAHWNQSITAGAQHYMDVASAHPDTNFVLVMGLEDTHKEIQGKNIQIVRLGTQLLDQKDEYQQLQPALNKNFDSSNTFICLNRSPRQHRINLVSYLLGLNLETFGIISFYDSNSRPTWIEKVSWELTKKQQFTKKNILCQGYKKIKNLSLQQTIDVVDLIYQTESGSNAKNFDASLRYHYTNSFVEIISETLFNTLHFGISEKFLNSVYGCNFPIMIAGQGAVKFLTDIGFDMFNDIVDHSYDDIADPLDRLCASIDRNIKLLSDVNLVKQLWQDNRLRFLKNVDFAKNIMHEKFRQRAIDEFKQIKWNV